MRIDNGNHAGTLDHNCVMEHVALEYLRERGVISTKELLQHKTDSPGCTAPWITSVAQNINDRLNDVDRQKLVPFIPRLLRAHNPADPEKRKRVAVRVACWAAREVLHLVREEDRAVCEGAIEAAEGWLAGTVTFEEVQKARAAAATAAATATTADADAATAATAAATATYAATADAATAAYATADAADAAAYAAAYAAAAADADAADAYAAALIDFLDGLLDAHDKALAEEGLLGDEDAFEVWAIETCPL